MALVPSTIFLLKGAGRLRLPVARVGPKLSFASPRLRCQLLKRRRLVLLRRGFGLRNQSEHRKQDVLIHAHQPRLIVIGFLAIRFPVHLRTAGPLNDRFKTQLAVHDPEHAAARAAFTSG